MAKPPARPSSSAEIQTFLQRGRDIARFNEKQCRLLFAVDATASRQPTWTTASRIQQEMFSATESQANLAVQLCYYRGFNDFYASRWLTDSASLAQVMGRVSRACISRPR